MVYQVLQSGWVGVDLFFVLSGFLITGILQRTKGAVGYFRTFYARRSRRIFPLYFSTLLVVTVLLPVLLPESNRLHGWLQPWPWLRTYTMNVKLATDGWHESRVQGLDHFWSLAVEEQFYLLWPVAVWALDRRWLIGICALTLVGSPLCRVALNDSGYPLAAYVLMPARIDALGAGALVALCAAGERGLERVSRASA